LLKSVEDISATKKRFRIEIPSEVVEKEIGESIEKLRQKAKIPGFRPGRVPVNIIEKRFGKGVEAEVLDKIIPEYCGKAFKEAEFTPAGMPVFDEKLDYKRNNPVNLSFTVEVMPRIENLDYDNIKIKDIPVVVDDKEVEDYLERLRQEKAVYEVSEKEVDTDDMVSFDCVDAKIVGQENVPSVKDDISKMGNEILPPDIMEKMIGRKKGDIVGFTTTFREDCESKKIAGKTVDIKVTIKEIKKKKLPAIDDEFAKDLGLENISEMKEKIKEKILAVKKEHAARMQKAQIVNQLMESREFEVPESLLKREIESLIIEQSTSETKEMAPAAGETEHGKEDEKELQDGLRQKALNNVRASIVVDAIGQKEGIMVTDDELKNRIFAMAQRLSTSPENVVNFYKYKEGSLEGLRHTIFEDKVLDLLLSKAFIEKGE
jgi:trigger factor